MLDGRRRARSASPSVAERGTRGRVHASTVWVGLGCSVLGRALDDAATPLHQRTLGTLGERVYPHLQATRTLGGKEEGTIGRHKFRRVRAGMTPLLVGQEGDVGEGDGASGGAVALVAVVGE